MPEPTLIEDAAAIACYLEALVRIRDRRWKAITEAMNSTNQDQEQLRYGWDLAKAISNFDPVTAKAIMCDLTGNRVASPGSTSGQRVIAHTSTREVLRRLGWASSWGAKKLSESEAEKAIRVDREPAGKRTKIRVTVLDSSLAAGPKGILGDNGDNPG